MSRPSEAASAAADDDARPDDIPAEAEASEPETILIEHQGQTYELPAALKGALMRQADYTRKTQELARQRQALAEAGQALAAHADALANHGAEHGRVSALEQQIAGLNDLNWPVLQQQNPAKKAGGDGDQGVRRQSRMVHGSDARWLAHRVLGVR